MYPNSLALNENCEPTGYTDCQKYPVYNQTDGVDICKYGRRPLDYHSQGTGSGLWLQTGWLDYTTQYDAKSTFSSANLFTVPTSQISTESATPLTYTGGKCFRSQGVNFFPNTVDKTGKVTPIDCVANTGTYPYPYKALYNSGRLNAFAFFTRVPTSTRTNPHWEHPMITDMTSIYYVAPTCYYTTTTPSWMDNSGWSVLHVYFDNDPMETSNC